MTESMTMNDLIRKWACDDCVVEAQKDMGGIMSRAGEYCCYCERKKNFEADLTAWFKTEAIKMVGDMKIERKWAMPNRWTFTIKPIKELLAKEMGEGMFMRGIWIDPFAGENSPAQITNDLNPARPTKYHLEALEFLKMQEDNSCDGALFDPPYSPRQVQECYQGIGAKTVSDNTRMDFWSKCKNELKRIVKPNGKIICFGWNSMGMGKNRGFEMTRILIVPHGTSKNDTICTVEIKCGKEILNRINKEGVKE